MESWVDLGSLIVVRSGIEPTTAWSQVRHPNHYATESPLGWPQITAIPGKILKTDRLRFDYLFIYLLLNMHKTKQKTCGHKEVWLCEQHNICKVIVNQLTKMHLHSTAPICYMPIKKITVAETRPNFHSHWNSESMLLVQGNSAYSFQFRETTNNY